VVLVPLDQLLPADSPRCAGEDPEHVRRLAGADATLPPIIVHRSTMRVIDGMHRLRAARARGRAEIEVWFFEGSEADAFVLAVRSNTTHGLPLSSADREASALRIRASTTGNGPQLNARIGRDGRVRPVDATEGRRRAYELITTKPSAALREIAMAAGVSLGTARDVRARVRRGDDPLPDGLKRQDSARGDNAPQGNFGPRLQSLMRDPSLRFTEHGRKLLRLLGAVTISDGDYKPIADVVPEYCATSVAELARQCAQVFRSLAEELEKRERSTA
jgi:hypothetical protein